MNARQLAALTRQLIATCGGLDESARACRLKKSRLAQCQDPESGAFLPLDALNALEIYAAKPVISRELVEDQPGRQGGGELGAEACETAEESLGLQRLIRTTLDHPKLTPRQAKAIEAELMALIDHVRRVHAALLTAEAKQ